MLNAQKAALENSLRQRLVGIRERELEYYTKNCRLLGDLAALLAGFAYSGIRYHYLLERQHSWMVQEGDAVEEVVFLSLLTLTLGCGLQTVVVAMLVAMLGPSLALRGPDGALHDSVHGMQMWNSVMLALFMVTLMMLQMSALSFTFGHAQMGVRMRGILSATIVLTIGLTLRYSRIVTRKFRVPQDIAVTGAFFDTHGRLLFDKVTDVACQRRFARRGRTTNDTTASPASDGSQCDGALDELDEVLDETLELSSTALLGARGGQRRTDPALPECAAHSNQLLSSVASDLIRALFSIGRRRFKANIQASGHAALDDPHYTYQAISLLSPGSSSHAPSPLSKTISCGPVG